MDDDCQCHGTGCYYVESPELGDDELVRCDEHGERFDAQVEASAVDRWEARQEARDAMRAEEP